MYLSSIIVNDPYLSRFSPLSTCYFISQSILQDYSSRCTAGCGPTVYKNYKGSSSSFSGSFLFDASTECNLSARVCGSPVSEARTNVDCTCVRIINVANSDTWVILLGLKYPSLLAIANYYLFQIISRYWGGWTGRREKYRVSCADAAAKVQT